MAYVQSPLPQDQQNQLGPTGTTTPNPLGSVPPQTGGSSGTGTGGGAPGVGSPTQFGSSASKLSDYLSANKDQIQNVGNQIAGTLGNQYGQTMGDINSATQGFTGQVNAGYAPQNQSLVNEAAANPTAFASNPSNVSAFQQQYNDQYTGPTSFESTQPYTNVQNEVQNAVSNANLINSPAGLSTYLRGNVENNPTPGENTLDTVLLQAEPNANQAITAAAAPYAGLSNYFGNQTAAADTLVPQAQTAAQQAQTAAQNAFTGKGGVIPGFQQTLNDELAAATAQRAAQNQPIPTENADINTFLGNGTALSPQDMAALGITSDQANTIGTDITKLENRVIPGVGLQGPTSSPVYPNLSQYFTPGAQNTNIPTAQTIATPDQYAEAQALQQLTGSPISGLDISNPALAGSYSSNGKNPSLQTQQVIDYLTSLMNTGPIQPAQPLPVIGNRNPNSPHSAAV